jgi:glucoamylase
MDRWGRPQNDGPALRAITLIHYMKAAAANGNPAPSKQLYDADPVKSVLKADLEFVAAHWQDTSFDLWEEIKGHHFYTQMVQRRALLEGAAVADANHDSSAATFYRQQAKLLEPQIEKHFDASKGYILTTFDKDDGIDHKQSNLDASSILASMHALGDDDYLGPTDDRVIATATQIENAFRGLYPINSRATNDNGDAIAISIGRYAEDVYDGVGTSKGNPWVLLTAAMGEYYYRVASMLESKGRITISALNLSFFQRLLPQQLQLNESIPSADARFSTMIKGLRNTGDAYLRRVQYHAPADGSLAEEIQRNNGFMRGAADLTWNYAAILGAFAQRK